MYLKGKITGCDFTGEEYDSPKDGVQCIARGATGRWCCVMYMSNTYAWQHNIEALDYGAFEDAWAAHPDRQAHDYLEV